MTVETETSRVAYTGAGTTGPFPINFYFLANADIRAIKQTIATGAETELVLTTDFTLTGAGDEDGGELTLVSSLSSSFKLVIFRDPALLQEADYTPNDRFPSETHEQVADRAMMISQRDRDLIERAVRLPDGDTSGATMILPAEVDRASKALGFDAGGEITVFDPESAVTTSENVTFSHATSYTAGSVGAKLKQVVSVKDSPYNAIGDGVTNDTTAIQAAIDAVSTAGGGTVYFPPGNYLCIGLVLKSGVVLYGVPRFKGSSTTQYGVKFTASGTGIVIDTPTGSACNSGEVNGIFIQGTGASVAGNGIRFRDANYCSIKNCLVNNFADEGIKVDSTSIACAYEDILITNCLLNRTRVAKTGAFDLDGTDHFCNRCEVTTSQSVEGTVSSASLYCCAWVIRNSTNMLVNCIGEISDVGFHVLATTSFGNKFVGCRADLNYGHGWEIAGSRNMFTACHAFRNSRGTTNTYDGFNIAATTGGRNVFAACVSDCLSADAWKQRYGFNDNFDGGSVDARNTFSACSGGLNTTALFNMSQFQGSTPDLPHHVNVATDADATPSVDNSTFMRLTGYTTDTLLTDLDDAVGSQFAFVLGDPNVTIANNANIKTNTGINKRLRGNVVYIFQHYNGVWYEADADRDDSTFCRIFDDFLGDAVDARWSSMVGSDPQCVAPAIVTGGGSPRGFARITAGDDAGGTMALNGVQIDTGALQWRADLGGLCCEVRFLISAVTDVCVFVGFTDQVAALEMPFTLGAGDALTSNATDAVGVLFDTGADTDNWWLVGVANGVDATHENSAVAPTAATNEKWRIEVSSTGAATFYRNGEKIGSTMAGALSTTVQITPVIAAFSRAAATRNVDFDYIKCEANRE